MTMKLVQPSIIHPLPHHFLPSLFVSQQSALLGQEVSLGEIHSPHCRKALHATFCIIYLCINFSCGGVFFLPFNSFVSMSQCSIFKHLLVTFLSSQGNFHPCYFLSHSDTSYNYLCI